MPIFSAIAFDNNETLNEEIGRVFQVSHAFSTASGNAATQYFKQTLADVGLNTLKALYVDNSMNPCAATIVMGSTRQLIKVPGGSQGFYRVLGSMLDLDYTIVSYSGLFATAYQTSLYWLNAKPCDPAIWSTQPSGTANGIPFTLSQSAGNAAIALTAPAYTGLTNYISYLSITGQGATSATGVQATLGPLAGIGATPNALYDIVVTAGVNSQVAQLELIFNPPLVGAAGVATVLTVPAFGAGNTSVAATMAGFCA